MPGSMQNVQRSMSGTGLVVSTVFPRQLPSAWRNPRSLSGIRSKTHRDGCWLAIFPIRPRRAAEDLTLQYQLGHLAAMSMNIDTLSLIHI